MAKCNMGNHGECAGCEIVVNPASPHHHVWWIGRAPDCLCSDCSACVIKASRIVLEALAAVYGDQGSRVFEHLIDQDAVRAVVQLPMDFQYSTN